jgi:hypothetical protein
MPDPISTQLGASTLVRKWLLEVNTGTNAAPVWTVVRGVQDFKPTVSHTTQDDSDFDSNGWKSSTVTAIEWSVDLKVARKLDSNGGYDAGQEFLRAKGTKTGLDATAQIRFCEVHNGPRIEAHEGTATVSWSPDGGGMDALDTVAVMLGGVGIRKEIAHPYPAA